MSAARDGTTVIFTTDELVEAFTQWKAEYDADPEGFQEHLAFLAEHPVTYGQQAADTLLTYLGVPE